MDKTTYMAMVGGSRKGTLRNQTCYCGSGKKYKRCCMNKGRKPFAWKRERLLDRLQALSRGQKQP